MSSAPLAVPASPSSSKRSRSRDSSRSAATSVNTPAASTPFLTPSASAPSLIIPQPKSQAPSIVEPSPLDATPYPAFLRLTRSGSVERQSKFVDLEWEQRRRLLSGNQQIEPDQTSQWARCGGEVVTNRNRYANVDPYCNNRVKLKVPEGHNDYINASPIVLEATQSKTVTKFIATQGPKGDSFSHIWRMIWHETKSPAVVVMLTQTHESGREKCHPYYPQSPSSPTLALNQSDEFEDGFAHIVTLKDLTVHEEASAQIRELEMSDEDGSETRTIWHFLFGGWPDFLVPEGYNRTALLNLIKLSREKNANNAENPRIVHCSAGVGRSGTFIALDWLLQELEEGTLDNLEDDEDPIVAIVDMLRQQRMMMVQGEAQFSFLYDVMRERWRDRWAKLHPEEAEKLGLGAIHEPKPKKPRPSKESEVSETDEDEDMRAQLEAELVDNQADFDKGKT
ncbi:tyrosine-protein phosphatase 2 [Lindgomyces ingoldianus]|uniref:Tyrosine-protein phosphatase 2 n=1 Tax=Lindgomyces ingoldianus TaxID=673940 RepID=A0ACB6QTV6_9PLEO|nr:tyrosine-protein phosphatase 2 [Lindgomyces ingoldianus]KAF2470282.1 tyrosine-protein phosphatase 2 [Lindgomyces ingoldianus]